MERRIKTLLAVHAISLPLAAVMANSFFRFRSFQLLAVGSAIAGVSLMLSQAGLLALWGALGKCRWRWRLSGGLLGLPWFSLVIPVAEGRWEVKNLAQSGAIVFLSMTAVFSTLAVLRLRHGLLFIRCPPRAGSECMQFSIAHIFAGTAGVAGALAIQQGVQQLPHYIQMVINLALCSALVNLAAMWGALGSSRPFVRLLIAMPPALLVGLGIPGFTSGDVVYLRWLLFFGGQALVSSGTLLVLRSCGWRLCWGANETQVELPEESFETTASAQEA